MNENMDREVGYPQQVSAAPLSAMAIAGLVLGIVALLTSFLPFINNFSFFLALLGVIFGIVGLVATIRQTRRGKALAIVALIIGIVSIVVVIASQSFYGAVIDEATSGPSAVGTSEPAATDTAQASEQNASPDKDYSNLAVGTAADLENGLSVSVQSVETGLTNYDDSEITGVTVTYTNNGSKEASFNVFDWKAQDAQGAQRNFTFYSEAQNELNSGTLAPGGTVTGNVYFDAGISKVLYYSSLLSDSSIAWTIAS